MNATRIALLGPAKGAGEELEEALDRLLDDSDLRHIIYLGNDSALEDAMKARQAAGLSQEDFLTRSVELACAGDAEAIDALLVERRGAHRLSAVRRLPAPPALAVEMLEKWILVLVHDKAVLEEDDIANAHIIVYGKSTKPYFKRFGPRCFYTPGALAAGHIGLLELQDNGDLAVKLIDRSGETVRNEVLQGAGTKFSVTE